MPVLSCEKLQNVSRAAMYSQGFSTLPKTEFKFEHSADVHSQPVQTALSSWYSKEVRNGFCIPVCTVSNSISCASKVETNLCLELV